MPRDKAIELIEKYNTNDPFELASINNVTILSWALHPDIKGFYKYMRRSKFIILNMSLEEELRRFVCAHELGHAVLHPRENTPFMRKNTLFSINKIEVEANTFAVEVLLPDEKLEDYRYTKLSLEEISTIHGVPEEVARLKAYSHNYFF